jgi:hypothetical protein
MFKLVLIAALVFAFACWFINIARKRERKVVTTTLRKGLIPLVIGIVTLCVLIAVLLLPSIKVI